MPTARLRWTTSNVFEPGGDASLGTLPRALWDRLHGGAPRRYTAVALGIAGGALYLVLEPTCDGRWQVVICRTAPIPGQTLEGDVCKVCVDVAAAKRYAGRAV